jgi:hypothetical protein
VTRPPEGYNHDFEDRWCAKFLSAIVEDYPKLVPSSLLRAFATIAHLLALICSTLAPLAYAQLKLKDKTADNKQLPSIIESV